MIDLTEKDRVSVGDLVRASRDGHALLTSTQFERLYEDLEVLSMFGLLEEAGIEAIGLYVKEDSYE